jgi:hypothetical protein
MASNVFTNGATKINRGDILFLTHDIKVLLLKGSGYTPDKDHDTLTDLVLASNEVTVAGYSRKTLASKTITTDDTNDRTVFDAADVSWASLAAGETVSAAVVFYDPGTGDANCVPIAYIDLTDTPLNGGAFDISWSSSGLFYLQA